MKIGDNLIQLFGHHICTCDVNTVQDILLTDLICRPMPDRYVERYGPVTDVSRQPVPRSLSRPVKRRASTDDDGQKKKGGFGKFRK